MNVVRDMRAGMRPRSMGLLLVMAAHAALAWLLVSGLGLRLVIQAPQKPIAARVIEAERPPLEQPLVPQDPSALQPKRIDWVAPEFPLFEPDSAASDTALDATIVDTIQLPSDVPPQRRTAVGVDPRHPLTQPPYPAASVRLGEEGTVTVEVRVGLDGRVQEARVLRSSGFARLDAAALEEARRMWRLRPATVEDAAVEAWYAVRVSFRLDRR